MSEEAFQKILNQIDSRLKNLESKEEHSHSAEKQSNSKPQHQHRTGMGEHVAFDCPECKQEYDKSVVEKAAPKILEEKREKIHKMEYPQICDDCGEVYDFYAEEDCPTCRARNKTE